MAIENVNTSTNADQNRQKLSFRLPFVVRLATHDNRKHLFLAIFDPRSSIVKSVSIAAYPVWDAMTQSIILSKKKPPLSKKCHQNSAVNSVDIGEAVQIK